MLWKRSPTRCFAQLDASGRCQAFWMLRQAPATGNWIEVSDVDPRWIGHHLYPQDTTLPSPGARR